MHPPDTVEHDIAHTMLIELLCISSQQDSLPKLHIQLLLACTTLSKDSKEMLLCTSLHYLSVCNNCNVRPHLFQTISPSYYAWQYHFDSSHHHQLLSRLPLDTRAKCQHLRLEHLECISDEHGLNEFESSGKLINPFAHGNLGSFGWKFMLGC